MERGTRTVLRTLEALVASHHATPSRPSSASQLQNGSVGTVTRGQDSRSTGHNPCRGCVRRRKNVHTPCHRRYQKPACAANTERSYARSPLVQSFTGAV
jgi:hypothetical protein